MRHYHQIQSLHKSLIEKLKVIHIRIYLLSLAILVNSLLVSQVFLHVFKNPMLFLYSSFALLIAGLPILGFQLRKGREIDREIVSALLKGAEIENLDNFDNYFRENTILYRKQLGFVVRSMPVWCLSGLIIAWARFILKLSNTNGIEDTLYFMTVCFSAFSIYVLIFTSAPYRVLRRLS